MRGSRYSLRYLAAALGGLFLAATAFQLLDQLNLIVQPPTIPDTANLVESVTARIPYRQQVWPLFLAANGLFALGFIVLSGLGIVLARRVGRDDDRGAVLLWTLGAAGILGAIGQLVLIGSVKTAIDIPYCDCGFKNEEIVSQVWALMVVQGASDMLVQVGSLLAAAGVVVAALAFGGRAMSPSWAWLSYAIAIGFVVVGVLSVADVLGDVSQWLTVLLTGILVPVWAFWLASTFRESNAAPGSTEVVATSPMSA
jgi:hypothetical protein